MNEDSVEIDLRPYILALARKWWVLALCVVLFAGATYAYYSSRPDEFSATASILLTRSRSSLSLTKEFTTVTENVIDSRSRLDALVSLTDSDAIAKKTLDAVKEQLPSDGRTLELIKTKVKIGNKGDLILVTATTHKPELSADIANAWARNAVQAINLAYSGEQPLNEIEIQLQEVEQEYMTAQTALETFVRENRITTLQRRINEATKVIDMLEKRQQEHQDLLLTSYYERIANMDKVIIQGQALREQIESGESSIPGGTGDALAVLLARSQTFGLAPDIVLQPDLVEISSLIDASSKYIADLDLIIRQATEEKAKTEKNIDGLSREVLIEEGYKYLEALSDPTDPLYQAAQEQLDAFINLESPGSLTPDYIDRPLIDQIENTANQVRDLSARLENEKALELQLTSKRDTVWEAFQILSKKVTEIRSATRTNNLVTIASLAVAPQKPANANMRLSTLIAGVLGGLVGIIGVILFQWWKFMVQPSHGESTSITANSTTK